MGWLTRFIAGISVVMVVLAQVAWLLWVPTPREPNYVFVAAFGSRQLQEPTGIALTADEVLVADGRVGRIVVFDRMGNFRRSFGSGVLGWPMHLAVAGDSLYVADYWHDRITVFGLDGTLRRHIGRSGRDPGTFDSPGGVAISPDGTLFVADGYNDRIQAFSPDGRFLRKWGGPLTMNVFGPFPGWFATVTDIALDGDGCVYVADFYNHRSGGPRSPALHPAGQADGFSLKKSLLCWSFGARRAAKAEVRALTERKLAKIKVAPARSVERP
ncbi:hypothetical protein JCM13664_06510 [Methylothermus subterraneus]